MDKKDDHFVRMRNPNEDMRGYNPRYSRFIRAMRLFMPILVVVIVVAVISWLYILNEPPIAQVTAETAKMMAKNQLESPHFQSVDEQNQPFSIAADYAVQDQKDENIVILDNPKAQINLNDGQILNIKSAHGTYHQTRKTLLLNEDVVFFDDADHVIKTARLDVHFNESRAVSDVGVRGDGPEGYLEGAGMVLNSADDILILNGPAKAVLYQSDLNSHLQF